MMKKIFYKMKYLISCITMLFILGFYANAQSIDWSGGTSDNVCMTAAEVVAGKTVTYNTVGDYIGSFTRIFWQVTGGSAGSDFEYAGGTEGSSLGLTPSAAGWYAETVIGAPGTGLSASFDIEWKTPGTYTINISAGNPYYNPHLGRPCDVGPYVATEHPLMSVERLLNAIRQMKQAAPDVVIMGTGFSWLREYGANVAAGAVEQGYMDIAGFGRQAFAYPDFAKDIIEKGCMDGRKCCIACTKCSELMRFRDVTGCVIRDSGVYLPIWKKATDGRTIMSNRIDIHI